MIIKLFFKLAHEEVNMYVLAVIIFSELPIESHIEGALVVHSILIYFIQLNAIIAQNLFGLI